MNETPINCIKCFICQGEFKHTLKIGERVLLQCQKCGLYSLLPKQSWLTLDYKTKISDQVYFRYYKTWRIAQYRQELPEIIKWKPNNNLLDIGAGWGWFLTEGKKFGLKGVGIEPQKIKNNSNISNNTFENWRSNKTLGVVTLWSVLEHFPKPEATLKKINKVLDDKGLLVIQTPNSKGLLNQVSIIVYWLTRGYIKIPLESLLQLPFASKHWFIYDAKNLTMLLEKHGFKIVSVKQKDMVDWKNLNAWFESRGKKVNSLMLIFLQLGFWVYQLISTLINRKDELVIFAIKN